MSARRKTHPTPEPRRPTRSGQVRGLRTNSRASEGLRGEPDRSIVVGTDGSPSATTAVRRAAALARAEGARLHIVTAYEPAITASRRKVMDAMPEELSWKASPG